MYTIESLKAINTQEELRYSFNEKVVNTVNSIISTIENRNNEIPQAGDICIVKAANGRIYNSARICKDSTGLSVCTQPYVPFTSSGENTSQSGGYFQGIKLSDIKKIDSAKKEFWCFAAGSGGHKGIHFYANVTVWEFTGDTNLFY